MMPFWEVINWEKWLTLAGFLFFVARDLLGLAAALWFLHYLFGWYGPLLAGLGITSIVLLRAIIESVTDQK